jgi:hypothetical protein
MKRKFWEVIGLTAGALLIACTALAEEETEQAPQPAKKVQIRPKAQAKPKAKGIRREKETEGTEAPNRFEADTVIKSQYKFNGEQLEVDPD